MRPLLRARTGLLWVLLTVLFCALPRGVEGSFSREIVYPVAFLHDGAQLLGRHDQVELQRLANRFQDRRVRIAVVVTPDFGDASGAAWTRACFEKWGAPGDGMLVALSASPPSIHVEIGPRLGAYLAHDRLHRMLGEVASPRLQQGEIAAGLILFLRSLADEMLGPDPHFEESGVAYRLPEDQILDPDDLLDRSWRARVRQARLALEARGLRVGVALVTSSYYYTPERWSRELFEFWGMQDLHQRNGVLVTVCLDPREVVFQLGEGTERFFHQDQLESLVRIHGRSLVQQERWGYALVMMLRALEQLAVSGRVPDLPLAPQEPWEPGFSGRISASRSRGVTPEVNPEERRNRLQTRSILINLILPLLGLGLTLLRRSRRRLRSSARDLPGMMALPGILIRLGVCVFAFGHGFLVWRAGLPVISWQSGVGFLTSPFLSLLVALGLGFELVNWLRSRRCADCGRGLVLRSGSRIFRLPSVEGAGLGTAIYACRSCGAGLTWIEEFPARPRWWNTFVRGLLLNLGCLCLFLLVMLAPVLVTRPGVLPPGSQNYFLLFFLGVLFGLLGCIHFYSLVPVVPGSPPSAPGSPRLGGLSSGGAGAGRSY